MKKIPERRGVDKNIFWNEIVPEYRPVVLKGIFKDWPIVRAGTASTAVISDYVRRFDNGSVIEMFVAPPSVKGHFFYQDDVRDFNFQRVKAPFADCLSRIHSHMDDEAPPSIYMGSTAIKNSFPGLMSENVCHLLTDAISPRIWMGNKTLVQPHYDLADNIACVIAGRRRFTLFPPEQISNLYIGPIDLTPAGQPMSMVSLENPDLEKYPRYAEALKEAMVAELEPGDAIFIPSLWWHGVQALEKFNLLVNYWWRNSGAVHDTPYEALVHGLLTIRGLPEKERLAWRAFFEHYVFQTRGDPAAHLPPESRGVLGEFTPKVYAAVRAYLYGLMNQKK